MVLQSEPVEHSKDASSQVSRQRQKHYSRSRLSPFVIREIQYTGCPKKVSRKKSLIIPLENLNCT